MSQEQHLGLDQLAEFLSGTSEYSLYLPEASESAAIDPALLQPALVEWLEILFAGN